MSKFTKLAIPAVLGATCILGLAPASSSYASTGTVLPISSYYQMAMDAAHGHIFISEGSSSQNGILVTDLTGQAVTTITGQTGVMGLALSPDGSTLYAALRGGDAVTAINTTSLTQTASYSLPAGDLPKDVAVQSGKIWVSFDTGTPSSAGIGYFDLSVTSPTLQTPATAQGWSFAPQLAADPEDTGVLVAMGSGASWSVATYNTATSPVTTLAAGFPAGCNGTDLAVAPGGAEFALACHGFAETHDAYSTVSLALVRSLGSSNFQELSEAIAYDAAGDVATGFDNDLPNPDAYIFPAGETAAVNAYLLYELSPRGGILLPRGLSWLPDSTELFAVISPNPTSYILVSVASPLLPPAVPAATTTSVFCSGAQVAVDEAATCNVAVVDPVRDGLIAPTGTVSLTSDTSGGTFSMGPCTLSPTQFALGQATCSVTYTPGQVGTGLQTITGNFPGDVNHGASSGLDSIVVTLRTTVMQLSCQKVSPVAHQCTATVIDTSPGTFTPPTGTVGFTSSGSGLFSATQCTLSGSGNGTSCTVDYYTPPGVPFKGQTITATYGGDSTHQNGAVSAGVT